MGKIIILENLVDFLYNKKFLWKIFLAFLPTAYRIRLTVDSNPSNEYQNTLHLKVQRIMQ